MTGTEHKASDQGRQRLASLVTARRRELGMKKAVDLADATGLSPRLISDIENGKRDNWSDSTIDSVERALEWESGSIQNVLIGGSPTPIMSPADLQNDLRTGISGTGSGGDSASVQISPAGAPSAETPGTPRSELPTGEPQLAQKRIQSVIKVADHALILTQLLQSKELHDELSKSIADVKAATAVLEPLLHVPEVRSQYYQYSNDLTESVAKTIEALSGQIAEVSTDAQANKLVVSLQDLRANVARVAGEAHLPEPIANLPRREIRDVLERLAEIDTTLDFRPEAQRLEKALSPVLDTASGQLGYLSGLIEILNEAGTRLNRLAAESDLADEMDALMNAITKLSEQVDGLTHGVDEITDRT